MKQHDAAVVAAAIAYCEAHCDNEDEIRLVEWIAEEIGDAIARDSGPRFKRHEFDVLALPIKHREIKRRIVAKFGA